MCDYLEAENLLLNKSLKRKGVFLRDINIKVTSTRRYGRDTFRWTDAFYLGESIKGYSVDPRQPRLSTDNLEMQKLFELVAAKRCLLAVLASSKAA